MNTDDAARTVTFNAGAPSVTQGAAARFARWALLVFGGGACVVLACVSGYFNIRFAQRLGGEWHETVAWTCFAVGSEVFMSAMPIAWGEARRRGEAFWALVTGGLWAMAFFWSLMSAYGFAVSSRDHQTAQAAAGIEDRTDTREAIDRQRAQLAALGQTRPVAAVRADIETEYRRLGINLADKRCSKMTDWAQRWCPTIWALGAEIEKAQAADTLAASIEAGRGRLSGVPVVASTADPQAQGIASITGFEAPKVSVFISAFAAVMLVIFASFGPACVFYGARALRDTPEEDPVPLVPADAWSEPAIGSLADGFSRWATEFMEIDAGARISSKEAYRHYSSWAPAAQVDKGKPESFGKLLAEHADAMGAKWGRSGSGGAHYTGLKLRSNSTVKLLQAAQ